MAYDCTLIETYPGFGPELTTDGNMEDDPTTNWPGTDAAVTEEATEVHGGCLSLQVDPTAAPGWASQDITVEAGHRYRIGVWGLADDTAVDQWRVTIYVAAAVVWTSDWHNNDVAWEEEVKFYRVPDTITTIELRLEVDQIADTCYFDDVSVRREAPVEMTEIDLLFRATDDWALLDQGISINDPAIKEIWGGELEDQLVRREEGKRVIPMELNLVSADADTLIDTVNALEEMLRHAARYRIDGWGGEVFLQFKTDNATFTVWYPVITGRIDKRNLMKICNSDEEIDSVPVTIICEAYWESPFTYDLANLLDNPGFEEWNDGICDSQPDCWADAESIAAGTGTNQQETDTVEEGCEALRIEVAGINNADYKGVSQDIAARIPRDDIEYTLLAWVQNALITNGNVNVYAEGSASGVLATAVNAAAANDDYTMYECQFTPTAGDAAGNVWIRARILATAGACTGIAHIDKMLVMEASNVPTGWMSSSYLTNHYDRDANTVNFLSVCDVPGEVGAEARYYLDVADTIGQIRLAKRTRDDPCKFIWQLIPCEGYTTAEGGAGGACTPGLTDAACIDSDKLIDATSPSGSRINVTFAGIQTLALRCYWEITDDLPSYYGKFALFVVAKMGGATDTATIQARLLDGSNSIGLIEAIDVEGIIWKLYDGWEVFCFPIGTRDDELFGVGNALYLYLYASTDGTPTDDLHIAGAYLAPLDEAYSISGASASYAATTDWILKDMDGDRGCFLYDTALDRYYSNLGFVGSYPHLEPEVENWLYLTITTAGGVWTYDDSVALSLIYRPRGIFLRGTNL